MKRKESTNVGVSMPATSWSAEPAINGPNAGKKLLRHVAVITQHVPDAAAAEAAWSQYLGYRRIAQGRLPENLCTVWGTPAMTDRRWCLMAPESGQPCHIRFVESHHPGNSALSCGWNATELLARDPDGLAVRLRNSPFRILGGPADLFPQPRAPRAMQVRGPAGELVYFTRILPGGSRYGMKGARSEVDRAFIVTVGGRSLEGMQQYYGGQMGLRVMDRMPFLNAILADAAGLSRTTVFPTSIARIPGRSFLVEMDEYPAAVSDRIFAPGELPGGMAMVGFLVDRLEGLGLEFRAPPAPVNIAPYQGRRVGVTIGAAGEWIELIEEMST